MEGGASVGNLNVGDVLGVLWLVKGRCCGRGEWYGGGKGEGIVADLTGGLELDELTVVASESREDDGRPSSGIAERAQLGPGL